MGRRTAVVHQAVAAKIARAKVEGTDRWAALVRTTMPAGLVRDAILASPAWPDMAAAMDRLDARRVDFVPAGIGSHGGMDVCELRDCVRRIPQNSCYLIN
ncbi:hypothetical protein [Streptomyces sp. NPDC058701]|uniref:hypothetical protein n=1 Tax=Streptomyces sp. NPDC058701 TaxID=3346608 RepID=UPI00365BA982